MRRLFHEDLPGVGEMVEPSPEERRHLVKVLRARSGEKFQLLDGMGGVATATMVGDGLLEVSSMERIPPPERKVHLLLAPPRRHKMDQLLRQCSEVGVWSITPLCAVRGVANPPKDVVPERWKAILVEGCKQSGNPFLPEIHPSMTLKEATKWIDDRRMTGLFGDTGDDATPILKVPGFVGTVEIAWLVGPEGGFDPEEREFLRSAGLKGIALGQWTLRVETAAVFGAALLNAG